MTLPPGVSEKMAMYGYNGDGFRSGNYYTSYVSANSKFYSTDKYYGRKIYTPFWNHLKQQYQQYDCGVDCEYLGPRNLMMSMMMYVLIFSVFVAIVMVAVCHKEKMGVQRAPSFLQID